MLPSLHLTSGKQHRSSPHTVNASLTAREAAGLHALTEGWPAGLQLAALALQDRPAGQTQPALAGFSGSHRYVFDYLIDQVLMQQTEEVQTFMLETSLLDSLTAPLCDALTGRAGSTLLLRDCFLKGARSGEARNDQFQQDLPDRFEV